MSEKFEQPDIGSESDAEKDGIFIDFKHILDELDKRKTDLEKGSDSFFEKHNYGYEGEEALYDLLPKINDRLSELYDSDMYINGEIQDIFHSFGDIHETKGPDELSATDRERYDKILKRGSELTDEIMRLEKMKKSIYRKLGLKKQDDPAFFKF